MAFLANNCGLWEHNYRLWQLKDLEVVFCDVPWTAGPVTSAILLQPYSGENWSHRGRTYISRFHLMYFTSRAGRTVCTALIVENGMEDTTSNFRWTEFPSGSIVHILHCHDHTWTTVPLQKRSKLNNNSLLQLTLWFI